jgi:glycosyltransferase involved in cell wall biosynthesis
VIPLRVIHALGPERGPSRDGAHALIGWLAREGHAAAAMTPASDAPPIPGIELLRYGSGLVARLFGGRTEAARRIASWTPDLIHVHDLELLPAALDLGRRLGLSLVVTVDGRLEAETVRLLHDPRVAWVLIPTERHRAHCLARLGLDRDRVTFVPPGVDVSAAACVPYRLGDGAMVVGFAGACDEGSGVERLAAALAEVARETPVRGIYRPESAADAERIADLLGDDAASLIEIAPIARQDFLARIDVFVDPREDEHLSLPMIEAMACARPVLALAVGGAPELVRDGRTAVLAAPGDANGLVAGLRQLLDPARRRELGEAGRRLAEERYDVAVVGSALVELYRCAIGGTRSAAAQAEGSTVYRRISETRLAR